MGQKAPLKHHALYLMVYSIIATRLYTQILNTSNMIKFILVTDEIAIENLVVTYKVF